jgi:hypothetical protein
MYFSENAHTPHPLAVNHQIHFACSTCGFHSIGQPRQRLLRGTCPLFTEVRGETAWKMAEGLSSRIRYGQQPADLGPFDPSW